MRTLTWDQEVEFNGEEIEVEVTVQLEGSRSEGYTIEELWVHAPEYGQANEVLIAMQLMDDEQKILDKVESIINS